MQEIDEWQDVDFGTFHSEIVASNRPAVLRSLIGDWPAVVQSNPSPEAACQYLTKFDNGNPVYTIAAPPEAGGRFFYREDLRGVNFKRAQIPFAQVLTQLQAQDIGKHTHSLAVQALSVRDTLPGFEAENPASLLDADIAPTMWVGNRGQVAPHYDVHRNLACVVAGRRQFILFPPEQISNLYLGPILGAPGGVPISLVDAWNPDLGQFPRFAEALEAASEATLAPGDAIYIPSLWWHGVASLESVNVLVNYWWNGIPESNISPNDSLMHSMLSIAKLDESQRAAWRAYFEHYVFRGDGEPAKHLPGSFEDLATIPNAEQVRTIRMFLSENLKRET